MLKPRIIARLDIKGEKVVKGICFEGLRVMGDPDILATKYYNQGADELLYIDTVASLYGRNNLTDVVKIAATHIFIPMVVGGGIRSVEDAHNLFRSGADKIAINTEAVKRPELIMELAKSFGSQALVLSLQIKQISKDNWEIYIDNGREKTGLDALDWARKVEDLGAGEILITSVDRDGTGKGYEENFLNKVTNCVRIPVIAAGGAKNPHDIVSIIQKTKVDAIAVASMLHYNNFSVSDIKETLVKANIPTALH